MSVPPPLRTGPLPVQFGTMAKEDTGVQRQLARL